MGPSPGQALSRFAGEGTRGSGSIGGLGGDLALGAVPVVVGAAGGAAVLLPQFVGAAPDLLLPRLGGALARRALRRAAQGCRIDRRIAGAHALRRRVVDARVGRPRPA